MVKRQFKIGKREQVEFVFKKGFRLRSPFFQWRVLRNHSTQTRFAVIISTKTSKKAVERNRMRRRVYEAIQKNLEALPKTCYDVVVLISKLSLNAPFEYLSKEVKRLMKAL